MASTQAALASIPGKTVDSFERWFNDRELLIKFTDNTYLLVGATVEALRAPRLSPVKLELDRHGSLAVAAGLYTEQERVDALAARDQAAADLITQREFDYYLELKARFEP